MSDFLQFALLKKMWGIITCLWGFFCFFFVLLFEEQHLDLTVNKNDGNLQIDNWKCRLSCMYQKNAEKGGSNETTA